MERRKRRHRRHNSMPQPPGKLKPRPVRSRPWCCPTSAGQNHGIVSLPCISFLLFTCLWIGLHHQSDSAFLICHVSDPGNPALRKKLNSQTFHLISQHIRHRCSLLTGRIQITVPVFDPHTQLPKKVFRFRYPKPLIDLCHAGSTASIIAACLHNLIGEIAFPISRRQNFLSNSVIPFV